MKFDRGYHPLHTITLRLAPNGTGSSIVIISNQSTATVVMLGIDDLAESDVELADQLIPVDQEDGT
jgi:hypothetical protein